MTLKLKALAFSTFLSIQALQLLWGCGELLNSLMAGLPSAQKVRFGCYCTCRWQVFCPLRMMPGTVEFPWGMQLLVSIPAGPRRAVLLSLWCCLAPVDVGPQIFLFSCPAQDLCSYRHAAHAQPEEVKRKATPTWARPTPENQETRHEANHQDSATETDRQNGP